MGMLLSAGIEYVLGQDVWPSLLALDCLVSSDSSQQLTHLLT